MIYYKYENKSVIHKMIDRLPRDIIEKISLTLPIIITSGICQSWRECSLPVNPLTIFSSINDMEYFLYHHKIPDINDITRWGTLAVIQWVRERDLYDDYDLLIKSFEYKRIDIIELLPRYHLDTFICKCIENDHLEYFDIATDLYIDDELIFYALAFGRIQMFDILNDKYNISVKVVPNDYRFLELATINEIDYVISKGYSYEIIDDSGIPMNTIAHLKSLGYNL